eukprot:NODE_43_length_28809_cov_0.237200.p12 type:complete len:298 gc:universal NODE_43_length_28809_cov_0.237200:1755-2648(+)
MTEAVTCSLSIRAKDKSGLLSDVLSKLKKFNLNLTSIKSTTTKDPTVDYAFDIIFTAPADFDLTNLQKDLESEPLIRYCHLTSNQSDNFSQFFPRQLRDLDTFADKVLSYGMELKADHPGFKDPDYRKRRSEITEKAKTYRTGMPLPHVNYTSDELKTWSTVYTKLTELFPTHACAEHQKVFPLLVRHCGYSANKIPQIHDISIFLKSCTGFTLRPVMGLLSSRDFLNGLAFRVFHSTQYIRHHSKPLYTPEPDVCHELLGHVPMFADADFADFSQEIGLASLGATDEDIKKLATVS